MAQVAPSWERGATMPMYTFYPCKPDGSATTFEALDLGDDATAAERAGRLIGLHPECAYVNVWQADRKVLKLGRLGPAKVSFGPFETTRPFRNTQPDPSGGGGPEGRARRRPARSRSAARADIP